MKPEHAAGACATGLRRHLPGCRIKPSAGTGSATAWSGALPRATVAWHESLDAFVAVAYARNAKSTGHVTTATTGEAEGAVGAALGKLGKGGW